MDGKLYHGVLQYQLKPFMTQMPKGIKYFFQQDLATWHISSIVTEKNRQSKTGCT